MFSWISISGSLGIYRWQTLWLPVTHWDTDWPWPWRKAGLLSLKSPAIERPHLARFLQRSSTTVEKLVHAGQRATQTQQKQQNNSAERCLSPRWSKHGRTLATFLQRSGDIWQQRKPSNILTTITSDLLSVCMWFQHQYYMIQKLPFDKRGALQNRLKAAWLIDQHKKANNSLQLVLNYDGALL